jgi:hypothetical protein
MPSATPALLGGRSSRRARCTRRLANFPSSSSTHERIAFVVLDRLDGEVNIEVWPVQMAWMRKRHVEKLPDRRVLEPREYLERKKQLARVDDEP